MEVLIKCGFQRKARNFEHRFQIKFFRKEKKPIQIYKTMIALPGRDAP